MSKNPHYTGLQTYSIPYEVNSIFIPAKMSGITLPVEKTSARQNFENALNILPDYIRPKNEDWIYEFKPVYNQPEPKIFNLHTQAPRRSKDEKKHQ